MEISTLKVNSERKEAGRLINRRKGKWYMEKNEVLTEDKDIENFTVNYTDGTQKVIDKGFFCEIKEGEEESTLSFLMAHCSGKDIATIVYGCVELGYKMGLFGGQSEAE